MHHDTWGLMQSHFCSPHWRPDSSHRNEPALGGYQLLLSTIQGTKLFIHYIEGSTAQLVKHKALNLMDVDSSPWWGLHHMMLFSLKNISKSQLNIILLSRPLGATRLYLQSPCSLLHNVPALGGYTGWSFYEHQAITSPRLLQAWQPDTWGL